MTDAQLLRGLEALRALDGHFGDRAFHKLRYRFLHIVALSDEAEVVTYVDGRSQWIAISCAGYTFRLPAKSATKPTRERARFVRLGPPLTSRSAAPVDVEEQLRALREATQAPR